MILQWHGNPDAMPFSIRSFVLYYRLRLRHEVNQGTGCRCFENLWAAVVLFSTAIIDCVLINHLGGC